ncbi:type I glyceraldehyde-3-phosphate dehydrogenase [Candidatus Gottesmanbacteria bacterium RIFCSPHIGHO2_01_FULL_42_12]|uniref:Glyceraldehyde-3-phosphate dehydrogenase n=1 Tax=Candidatus Gottesmanbacteria bacterium RIFCSPHIGHO2_01_FULL_42_12 TaxID=1798377 RepID=A0A1F5Z2X5_9BACT|nr:MAG: type I glyceraldehyde-3-phosphate dehydrogenase [Candidatus Gottesmanbacteria bacterium RIFCSPHIGHO2_01_FULL_42_12]
MIKVAINGYGRIGRVAHRVILDRFADQIEIVAINGGSSTDIGGWAYLLKYDTAYGPIKNTAVSSEQLAVSETIPKQIGNLIVNDKKIPFYSEKNPEVLPWKQLGVDVVIECTGNLLTEEKIKIHLAVGAKKVVLSAPAKDSTIKTYVLEVNLENTPSENIISNASCTTNCIAPVAQIMVSKFGVYKAMMTTMHAYTSDQRLQDGGHKDYRRARAAASNIVPTSTGAAKAAAETVPELKGLFTGIAVRVPVLVGSLSDFTFHLKRNTSIEEVNAVLKEEAQSVRYQHILETTTEPLVSSDIVGNPHSAIVDLSLTQVAGGDMVKIFAWYDNEWGYVNRLVEEVIMVGQK